NGGEDGVNFHHDGNFVPSPLMYQEGDESTIHDIGFEGMPIASDKPNVGESSQPCGKELEIHSDDEDVGKQFKLVDGVIYPAFDPKLPWNEMNQLWV
nr:60S ribosomal protein L34 [Tanacetum cinerariifolium]